jgi:hypothetical protein
MVRIVRGRNRVRGAVALLLVAAGLVGRAASAHGAPAGVTAVAAADTAGPSVVALTEGLAMRRGGEWRYLCQSQFGGELSPPALSFDGERTYVVGQDDLFILGRDGRVAAQHRPDLSRRSVLQLVATDHAVVALRFADGATELVPVDGALAAPLFHAAGPSDSVSFDAGSLWVARTEGTTGVALKLGPDGSVLEQRRFPVGLSASIIRMQHVLGSLYASVVTALAGGLLLRVDAGDAGGGGGATPAFSSSAPILGPFASDQSAWVESSGELYRFEGGAPALLPASVSATCLGTHGTLAYVCTRTRLVRLDPAGPGADLLDLKDLRGPDLDLLAVDAREACNQDWIVFREHLRLAGVILPGPGGRSAAAASDGGPATAARAATGCGCAQGARRPPSIGVAAIGLGLIVTRRRRARGRPRPPAARQRPRRAS